MFSLFVLLCTLFSTASASTIYIYDAAELEVAPLRRLFSSHPATRNFSVRIMNREILFEAWQKDAALLVFPGGTASRYDAQLGIEGRKIVYNFVAGGGKALFICAGAYWASAETEFAQGTSMERMVTRKPPIYPGKAKGPLIPYSYTDSSGTGLFSVYFGEGQETISLYFGGPVFTHHPDNDATENLVFYDPGKQLPAVIKTSLGRGFSILSGLHFEEDGETETDDEHLCDLFENLKARKESRMKLVDFVMQHLFSKSDDHPM